MRVSKRVTGIWLTAAALALAGPAFAPAFAQAGEKPCATISDANLPPAFAAWAKPATTTKAGATRETAARIEPGAAVDATLLPAITPALPPEQVRIPENAHAGLFSVHIPKAGSWRVALSGPAWIDLIGPKGAEKSTAHGHMAPCTSLKKAVEFELQPGDYLLQVSGNSGPTLKLLVSPKP